MSDPGSNYSDQVQFARSLANPSKETRDQTVSELNAYLSSLESYSEMEMSKLWKALFYCMWLTDKAQIQIELAQSLANLLSVFTKTKFMTLYLKIFYRTILREWGQLDQYRINKFYSLIRYMLRATFSYLHTAGWPKKITAKVMEDLDNEVLTKKPNGVRFHFADIFLEELMEATSGEISTKQYLRCIEPFFKSLQSTDDIIVHQRIIKRLFSDYLLNYARENRHKSTSHSTTESSTSRYFTNIKTTILQSIIFELASSETTRDSYRQALYTLHKEFQKVTKKQFITNTTLDDDISHTTTTTTIVPMQIQVEDVSNVPEVASVNEVVTEGISDKKKKKKKDKKILNEDNDNNNVVLTSPMDDDNNDSNDIVIETKNTAAVKDIPATLSNGHKKSKSATTTSATITTDNNDKDNDMESLSLSKKSKKRKAVTESETETVETDNNTTSSTSNSTPSAATNEKKKHTTTASTAVSSSSIVTVKEVKKVDQVLTEKVTEKDKMEDNLDFYATKKFQGKRPGYVFKLGVNGVGYYIDTVQTKASGKSKNKDKNKSKPTAAVVLQNGCTSSSSSSSSSFSTNIPVATTPVKSTPTPAPVVTPTSPVTTSTTTTIKSPETIDSNTNTSSSNSNKRRKSTGSLSSRDDGGLHVSFGAPISKDYVSSVKALKMATPSLSASPARGVLKVRVAPSTALKAKKNNKYL